MFNRPISFLLLLGACEFSTRLPNLIDASADAGVCTSVIGECIGDTFRECTMVGVPATDHPCAWGCKGPVAHCAQVEPAGGGANVDDVKGDGLVDVALETGITIDGDTGRIGTGVNPTLVRGAGANIMMGIDYQVRGNNIVVFRFKSLLIKGTLTLTGTHSIVLVSDGDVTIDGIVDARGACTPQNAGPGGMAGRTHNAAAAATPTGGASTTTARFGGGGGGNGGVGGMGRGGAAGGLVYGDPEITILRGGGGGGGGADGGESGDGGGGGGAVQIVSNTRVVIHDGGGINAGGCGGETGQGGNDGGGGGGAGGTILIEAPIVDIAGVLAVNGGGGGGGDANPDSSRADGEDGRPDLQQAAGFPTNEAHGGAGGANTTFDGAPGMQSGTDDGGGGGGGVGRIRINTRMGDVKIGTTAILSPPKDTAPTTFGSATLR